MKRHRMTEDDLCKELDELKQQYSHLRDDELFVLWFMRSYVTGDSPAAVDSLVGKSKDKSVDAVHIDEKSKTVFVVQGKYRERLHKKTEARNDLLTFARLASDIGGEKGAFDALLKDADEQVQAKLQEARERVLKRNFRICLYYVTTGNCSATLCEEADRTVGRAVAQSTIEVVHGRKVLSILEDYIYGVAPPISSVELELEAGDGVVVRSMLERFDPTTRIQSFISSVRGSCIAELFETHGVKLFARNVRGYLGKTQINAEIEGTLTGEPEFFWYYNNGITIVCDDARSISRDGRQLLLLTNPQIINGQQTTRSLHACRGSSPRKAAVLVRVIKVPRDAEESSDRFERLITKIVAATNRQNAIRPSDLMANDRRQIEIERNLRILGYHYIRKRQKKGEARRQLGTARYRLIKKEELAIASAGCDLDPYLLARGKEGLFEDSQYESVFPRSDGIYYLPRFYALREAAYAARGDKRHVAAKWVVLNAAWGHIEPLLRQKARALEFIRQYERNADVVVPVNRLMLELQADAMRFYRANRHGEHGALEAKDFFRRKGTRTGFRTYWERRGKKQQVRKWLRQIEDALQKASD